MNPSAPSGYFVSGGTMTVSASSYIERSADRELFSELLDRHYCYVLDARQMGKSSLAVRTIAKLREHHVRCVSIDLTRIGGNNTTPDQWYAGLCREVGRATGLESEVPQHWTAKQSVSPMQRFFDFLRDVLLPASSDPVVIFIDETDAVLSLPFSVDELLAGIREAYNRRAYDFEYQRLTFCLVGVALPTDLIRDARKTPFNIGTRIDLRDFTLTELGKFAEVLGPNGGRLIQRVHHWTNGHPYLTQHLCLAISQRPEVQSARHVDALVKRLFFAPDSRQTNTTLADVASRALHAGDTEPAPERFRADLLSTYDRVWAKRRVVDDESNRVIALLKLSGLTRSNGHTLRVRNRIYDRAFDREWVRENMPGQELRRQRRAFLLGAFRSGAVGLAFTAIVAYFAVTNAELAKSERELVKQERQARKDSDQARERTQRFAYRAYVLTLDNINEAFARGDYEKALQVLPELESEDQPIHGWELGYTAKRFHRVGRFIEAHKDRIYSMAFLPNGLLFTFSNDGTLATWNVETGELVRRYPAPKAAGLAGLYPDGRHVAIDDFGGNLCRFDLTTGTVDWTLPKGRTKPCDVAVSPDGRYILLTSNQRGEEPLLISAATGETLRSFSAANNAWTQCAAWSPDSRSFVLSYELAGHDQKTLMYTIDGRKVWENSRTNSPATVALCFSPDGRRLVGNRAWGLATIIDPATGSEGTEFRIQKELPYSISSLPVGHGWVTSALDADLKFWTADFKPIGTRHSDNAIFISAVDPTGRYAATTGANGEVYVWNIPKKGDDPQALGPKELAFPGRIVAQFAATPDGQKLVMSLTTKDLETGPFTLLCVRIANKKVLWEKSIEHAGDRFSFSPDGSTVLVSGLTAQVNLISVADGSVVRTIEGEDARFSPRGDLVAVGNADAGKYRNGWVSLLSSRDWQPIANAPVMKGNVDTLAFSPNGERLAAAGGGLSVHVFDTRNLTRLFELHGHNNDIASVRFDASGEKLYSVGMDVNLRQWNVATGTPEAVMRNPEGLAGCRDIEFLAPNRVLIHRWSGIQVWDTEKARLLLTQPVKNVCGAAIVLPDGDVLVGHNDHIERLER